MKHKHCELIKAWADGAEIQKKVYINGENITEPIISESWVTVQLPVWSIHEEYRIKPESKPDVVNYYNVGCTKGVYRHDDSDNWDLKLTFDGETGELKSAEVLK